MKSTILKYLALISLPVLLPMNSVVHADTLDTQEFSSDALTACNASQTIQIANGLANNTIANPGMTKTNVQIKLFNGDANCWASTINYQQTDTFRVGPGCGCQAVSTILIEPLARTGDVMSAYSSQTIPVTTKNILQISITQGAGEPAFDENTGLIMKQGTIKPNMQFNMK